MLRPMLGLFALLGLIGCLTAQAPADPGCAECHGTAESPAPPAGLGGTDDPAYIGVGAHSAHLADPPFSRSVACTECHAVPGTLDAEGHIDTPWPAEVQWGPLAAQDGAAELWSHTAATCTVYCHGASLSGGALATPAWTGGPSQAGCGSCHGMPPPPPHPPTGACGDCHAPSASGNRVADPLLHIDGVVQLGAGGDTSDTGGVDPGCIGCHGDATATPPTSAPPVDTLGNAETTESGVGAHAAHGSGGVFSAPVACTDCHVVPATVDAPGHLDPLPAEVVFSGVATGRGAAPVFAGGSCSDSYCHGTFGGGSVPSPSWTTVDGTQAACGGCHAMPPVDTVHTPANTECSACHNQVTDPGPVIREASLHCDGSVQLNELP